MAEEVKIKARNITYGVKKNKNGFTISRFITNYKANYVEGYGDIYKIWVLKGAKNARLQLKCVATFEGKTYNTKKTWVEGTVNVQLGYADQLFYKAEEALNAPEDELTDKAKVLFELTEKLFIERKNEE